MSDEVGKLEVWREKFMSKKTELMEIIELLKVNQAYIPMQHREEMAKNILIAGYSKRPQPSETKGVDIQWPMQAISPNLEWSKGANFMRHKFMEIIKERGL